ncbi:hypothetical protein BDV93DRAFT_563823 [Ceratobasidium sp. AG-I]|nr:hypothetical protein BDV93DRAFT_563823 [Ceratobasidium sp. AG-I]
MAAAYPQYPVSPATPCRHHPQAPNPQCLGCRMAMGGHADSYFVSSDLQVQRRYYDFPPSPPPAEILSPMEEVVTPGESDEESYLLRMRFALQEMDSKVDFVPDGRFLDLGCCPGGFSTYVLNKWPNAQGDGVSLPVELGGHSLAIPQNLLSRFRVHWGDMTQFNHALEHSGSGKLAGLAPFPIPSNTFNIVLADGHIPPPPDMSHLEDRIARLEQHRRAANLLLVSQLLAAVRAVKSGGTILVKLSLAFANQSLDSFMHRLVLALDRLSSVPVVALKPRSIYANKGSFYILARGVEVVPRRMLEMLLESLWIQLVEGGNVDKRALNRLVSDKETKSRREWLVDLLEPAEGVRREAKLAR